MTYAAECKACSIKVEYEAKITEKDALMPVCPQCQVKMEAAFIANIDGSFILKGQGWFKKGGY